MATTEGSPIGLGVVGHLYSKELTSGQKDTSIEKWFAKEIDSPFLEIIKKLSDESEIRRYKYHKNPDKAKVLRQLGYRVPNRFKICRRFTSSKPKLSR